ncbi:hypothetical protein EAX61_11140 [Dokdonia sinensis]|uniref:Right-handed parallel beta-helix repeat-containing protein n=1 Tax=Dokdonia sinensis TaxID=2479847 RepID=A0A3M0G982_9FLAO|nr:hypothetical protein [Dokdonia sinensis]RMB57659.1 hypothetical protein EAX61_11140 [Dokdonia sinensis]
MRYLYTLALLTIIVVVSSCRNDFETSTSTGELRFSRDTIYLDTVFTNIGSSTYNLKVYNRSDDAINIPTVRLSRGEASDYRLNVDGVAGREFNDVEILAKDSIFIFVETTIDINDYTSDDVDFLYTDAIEFDTGSNAQKVELVTLVKDATFIFPDREDATGIIETLTVNGTETQIQGRYLMDDELTFTSDKPYVVYGYMAVGDPNGGTAKTLNINPGARIHFHQNSGIIVANNASLKINGTLSASQEELENEVILEGDRLEPGFSDIPGQWGAILLTTGSVDNEMRYTTIKNATVGILNESNTTTGSPNLTLANTQIYNSGAVGLLNRFSTVEASNTVINNAGQFAMLVQLGGNYSFDHCTFTNYFTSGSRTTPAVFLDNTLAAGDQLFVGSLEKATFRNSIIYGNQGEELLFNRHENADFNFKFENTLIRFDDSFGSFEESEFHQFDDATRYENIIISIEPDFKAPNDNKLQIGDASAANGQGNPAVSQLFPLDLIGTNRTVNPDLGAYESIIFNED